ncbi:MAG: hypothetical protein CVU20_03320 [Betaproteobacteria bacterium HGW-Betaproteobacteria-14]|nr:MAG: hypothetical protein CVU20_03320 [Betaproteobacteria bacterium HGW-Betaproteobacteria-14]
MSIVALISVGLVIWLGFASHRASLCTVRAVGEIMTSGTAHMLSSFAKAAAWATAVAGAVLLVASPSGMSLIDRTPHIYTLAGGFLFGVGAAVNGACSLSTLQRLADGDISMLGTTAGLAAGITAWSASAHRFHLTASQSLADPWSSHDTWVVFMLSALWLWVAWEALRLWRVHRSPAPLFQRLFSPAYRLSTAAAIMGVSGGLLYSLQGTWTYTRFLHAQVDSWVAQVPPPSAMQGVLVLALVAGMLLSSWQRRSFALRLGRPATVGRRFAGGLLMGMGVALIPGGNDTLILRAIPTLSAWALAAYLALLAGVAVALLAMRALGGRMAPIVCSDDRCA